MFRLNLVCKLNQSLKNYFYQPLPGAHSRPSDGELLSMGPFPYWKHERWPLLVTQIGSKKKAWTSVHCVEQWKELLTLKGSTAEPTWLHLSATSAKLVSAGTRWSSDTITEVTTHTSVKKMYVTERPSAHGGKCTVTTARLQEIERRAWSVGQGQWEPAKVSCQRLRITMLQSH